MSYSLPELEPLLQQSPYQAYTYSYPHKSAYRVFDSPIPLAPLWQQEQRQQLMLYLHIPFCEMRCGFCNLFTLANPQAEMEEVYLQALQQQLKVMQQLLSPYRFSRFIMGGGTPTYLSVRGLEQLREDVTRFLGSDLQTIPSSIETSPRTATSERLQLLKEWGVSRISMGVQSTYSDDNRSLMRHQPEDQLEQALDAIKQQQFECLNLDLIYGIPGQSEQRWLDSLQQLLRWQPQEFYLYPLYQRPGTGLWQRQQPQQAEHYRRLYSTGRELLLSEGYQQISMRLFRHHSYLESPEPPYSCQSDGMVGLGAGARSYTGALHYCDDYALDRPSIKQIIDTYCQRSEAQMAEITYGIRLTDEDQKRRFLIQSLLLSAGLSRDSYKQRFGSDPLFDFPGLNQLHACQLASIDDEVIRLNSQGLAVADTLGPWLISQRVASQMEPHVVQQ